VLRRASVLIALITLSAGANAQRPDSTRNWILGVSAGIPGYEREPVPELFTVGLNVSQTKPGRLGADFSLGTMPRTLAFGAAVLGARAGVVFPISPSPDVSVLPSAGLSVVGGGGEGGAAAVAGFNAGIASIIWTGDVGVRMGVTWHRFEDFRGAIWLVELGVVRAREH
jgi:hypothetical protein